VDPLASLALGGLLADTAGITAVYAAGAILLAAAAAVGWNALRHRPDNRRRKLLAGYFAPG
jgi:hypothetical protein